MMEKLPYLALSLVGGAVAILAVKNGATFTEDDLSRIEDAMRKVVKDDQHFERAERDVAQIADRRGDQVEAGRKWRCRGGMPIKDIAAARALPPERERRGFGCAGSHLAAV